MLKTSLLFCLVCCSLAQWVDPNWQESKNGGWGFHSVKYPQLPKSYPMFNNPEYYNQKMAVFPTTNRIADTTEVPTTGPSTVPTTITPSTPSPTHSTSTTAPSETCTGIFSCADCKTAQICKPSETGLTPAFTLACPTSAPYCDYTSGTCSTVPDSKCGSTDNFFCTQDGYFPDPTDCTVYHACNNYQAKKFKCADQQTYDPDKAECRNGAPCNFTVNCTNNSEIKFEMADTHYFTYCSKGSPLLVSRCQGNYKLNTTSQVCEPLCEKDGLMADEEDCTKFYQCTTMYIRSDFSIPIRQNLACPSDEAFEPSSFQCLPKQMTTCKI